MSEFREPKIKVCKVDIKMLTDFFCGGPPSHKSNGVIICLHTCDFILAFLLCLSGDFNMYPAYPGENDHAKDKNNQTDEESLNIKG